MTYVEQLTQIYNNSITIILDYNTDCHQ